MEADPIREHELMMTRRQFFGRARLGVGTAALAGLMGSAFSAVPTQGATHHRPRAKRVIYLFMTGGPSQHDLFDYKPKMREYAGKELPPHIRDGQRVTGMSKGTLKVMPSEYSFTKYDNHDRGVWVSELLPHTAKVVKDLCVIHSVHTEAINHDPGITYIQTSSQIPGRPSLGAWLSYGLGSENSDLPSYIVMHSMGSQQGTTLFNRLWGSGFMPSNHQGVIFRGGEDPVLYLNNPQGVSRSNRRHQLDALAAINQEHYRDFGDPGILARLEQHEMAYRMQAAVPELMDLSQEPDSTWKLYGEKGRVPGTFEACASMPVGWLSEASETFKYSIAVGTSTTTFAKSCPPSAKMSTGGVKADITYGKTDEFGYNITDADGNPLVGEHKPNKHHVTPGAVHIHDLNATILHLLGIDHTKLTYRYQGRDFRLTDVHGHLVRDLLA